MFEMSKLFVALIAFSTINCSFCDENVFTVGQLGRSMAQCIGENEIINCFKHKFLETLDKAIADNETWHLSDVLVVEKNTNIPNKNIYPTKQGPVDKLQIQSGNNPTKEDPLAIKILQLAQSRSIKLQLPSTLSDSNNSSILQFNANANASDEESSIADATQEHHQQQQPQLLEEEGRRKKNKDKNMAMFGGMAMLAMVAQMFLSKIIMIAGAAFVMAKIALLISAMGTFRRGSSVGGGGGTDHVIVTGTAGGHSNEHVQSWHRRIPYTYNKFDTAASDEPNFTEPVSYYEVATKKDKFKKRNQLQMPANKKQFK